MSRPSQPLMTHFRSRELRSDMYDPERSSPKTNFILCSVLALLFGAAFWYSLTSTLDQQQRQHCEQGWQRACESLK